MGHTMHHLVDGIYQAYLDGLPIGSAVLRWQGNRPKAWS